MAHLLASIHGKFDTTVGKRSPVLGYNHNFKHRGLIFHVQTEDSGVGNPHLFTHLFNGGLIISSRKMDYDPEADVDLVKSLMQSQHKAVLKDLKQGAFDDKIDSYFVNNSELLPRKTDSLVPKEGVGDGVVAVVEETDLTDKVSQREFLDSSALVAADNSAEFTRPNLVPPIKSEVGRVPSAKEPSIPHENHDMSKTAEELSVSAAVAAVRLSHAQRLSSSSARASRAVGTELTGVPRVHLSEDTSVQNTKHVDLTSPSTEPQSRPGDLQSGLSAGDVIGSEDRGYDSALDEEPVMSFESMDTKVTPRPVTLGDKSGFAYALRRPRHGTESKRKYVQKEIPAPASEATKSSSVSKPGPVSDGPKGKAKNGGRRGSPVVVLQPAVIVEGSSRIVRGRGAKRGSGPVPKVRNNLFGKDLISEKSLDEVIMAYLSEDGTEE